MENKWLTREEFEFERGNYSWCWVALEDGNVYTATYYNDHYYQGLDSAQYYIKDYIKAVMPIEKPKYPTIVGIDNLKEIE